jgi:hypothetical protein
MRYISQGPVQITRATIEAAWRRWKTDTCFTIRDAECRAVPGGEPTTMSWRYW